MEPIAAQSALEQKPRYHKGPGGRPAACSNHNSEFCNVHTTQKLSWVIVNLYLLIKNSVISMYFTGQSSFLSICMDRKKGKLKIFFLRQKYIAGWIMSLHPTQTRVNVVPGEP